MLASFTAVFASFSAPAAGFQFDAVGVKSSFSSNAPSKIRTVREPGDPAKGELERFRSSYPPTGELMMLQIVYLNGTTMQFSYIAGRVQREEELIPHPAKKGTYRRREAFLEWSTGDKIWQRLYRIDGSLEQEDRYTNCCIWRTKYAADGKTEVSKVLLDKATESPMLHPTQQRIYR